MPSTIFAGQKVKTLKSTLNLNSGADIISSTTDPTSVAVDASPGSLLLNTTSSKLYRKNDSGSSTNWSEVGSGGAGINYVTNPTAATNTTGWSTYADAAGTAPVDGTGGSPTVTWTRSTSTPLRGAADFNLTKDAANRQGEGVSTDMTIDLADQAKVLTVSFDYEVLSGTYSTGDVTVYLIADPSGTPVVIQPAGYQVQSGTAGTKLKQIATFQTQATGQTYRLCFHVASTSASAYSLAIDNVVVGPQTVQYGAPVTDWVDFTPTFLNATTLNATGKTDPQGRYRRVGDSIEVQVTFQNGSGGAAAGTGDIALRIPAALTVDTAKLTATVGGYRADGFGTFSTATAPGQGVIVLNSYLYLLKESANDYYKIADLSASARWSVKATVPILGWSSTVQMSNDTDTRVVDFSGTKTATQAVTSSVTDVTFTSAKDSHGFWGGSAYTVGVPGDYVVSAVLGDNGANSWAIQVFRNGSFARLLGVAIGSSNVRGSGTAIIPNCVAGDTISIRVTNNTTLAGEGQLSIFRLSGPSAIAATESVTGKYENTAATLITSSEATIPYATKKYDSHGAFNGTVFTAPVSGVYSFSSTISTQSVSNSTNQVLAGGFKVTSGPETLSGSTQYAMIEFGNGAAHGQVVNFTKSFRLNAGDTVEVRCLNANSVNLAIDVGVNFFSWSRVGN